MKPEEREFIKAAISRIEYLEESLRSASRRFTDPSFGCVWQDAAEDIEAVLKSKLDTSTIMAELLDERSCRNCRHFDLQGESNYQCFDSFPCRDCNNNPSLDYHAKQEAVL